MFNLCVCQPRGQWKQLSFLQLCCSITTGPLETQKEGRGCSRGIIFAFCFSLVGDIVCLLAARHAPRSPARTVLFNIWYTDSNYNNGLSQWNHNKLWFQFAPSSFKWRKSRLIIKKTLASLLLCVYGFIKTYISNFRSLLLVVWLKLFDK